MIEILLALILAPGVVFGASGGFTATIAPDVTPDFYSAGFGVMSNGSLAIDSGTPAGNLYVTGIRVNSHGAAYGTQTLSGTDLYVRGLRISSDGAIVYAAGSPSYFSNGNPITAAGVLAIDPASVSVSFDSTNVTFDSTTVTWDRT